MRYEGHDIGPQTEECARAACHNPATSGPHRHMPNNRYCNHCRLLINEAAGFELVPRGAPSAGEEKRV